MFHIKIKKNTEPVKDIFFTSELVQISKPTSLTCLSVVTTLITPLGNPDLTANSAKAKAEYGVSAAGFITTVHPAANAALILRVIMALGKFQAVITPTTPTGCFTTTVL